MSIFRLIGTIERQIGIKDNLLMTDSQKGGIKLKGSNIQFILNHLNEENNEKN